ncbi:DNA-binding transcriptional regulator, PadR family [Streptomyces sp. Termitarium-T10T-6]|nr:DNA-binding transcriptional regulator, PadR family [Streptomyces sp. Termitarium-T10T-6]
MSAIRLLVLGAVRMHGRAHGYQVRNDLEYWGAHEWSNAKPGSIYHALKQMAKQGLLLAHETAPSTAGGPPRTEYEVTGEGLDEYRALLRDAIRSYDRNMDVLSAAVGFIVDLPREEAVALLKERIEGIREWREAVTEYYTPEERARIPRSHRRDHEPVGALGGQRCGVDPGPDSPVVEGGALHRSRATGDPVRRGPRRG